MTSPLAGSLARTIGKALAPIFLPATLVRGTVQHPCRAIFDKWNPERELPASDGTLLILAASLDVEPASGDVVNCQGRTVLIGSFSNTRPAIATDPAVAVWTLNFKRYPVVDSSLTSSNSAASAELAGEPFDLYRVTAPGQTPIIPANKHLAGVMALFAASKTGFNVKTALSYDTLLYVGQFATTDLQPGDYLVGPGATYFIAALPHLLPISCVRCNATVTIRRPSKQTDADGGLAQGLPSQPGGGSYWGASTVLATDDTQPGEIAVAANVPVGILGTTGRATGVGELPTEAPGPSRWHVSLPPSVCPKGFVHDRDVLIDDEGYRYQVSAAIWTSLGYRCEAIRMES